MVPPVDLPPSQVESTFPHSADARVDVVCVRAAGPVGPTRASIHGANLHVGERVAAGSAPYVLLLHSGDEVLGPTLDRLVAVLDGDPSIDVVYPMAVLGSELVVNAMVPEQRRLASKPYLSRGYLVRRVWLDEHGIGSDDHELWTTVVESGAGVEHLRSVGIRLWPQD